MSDWLSDLEAQRANEEAVDRAFAEEEPRAKAEARAHDLERIRSSFEANRAAIEQVYGEILTQVERCKKLGLRFPSVTQCEELHSLDLSPNTPRETSA